jgi:hypothetical protein
MIKNWIYEPNLRAFVELIKDLLEYDLDDDERNAIISGVRDSDAEEDRWYDYPFQGRQTATVSFGRDVNTEIVQIRVNAEQAVLDKVEVLVMVCQSSTLEYRLTRS